MMLLHQLFEQQVLQHPERVAVEFRDRRLTYGHLNDSANRLAAYIRFTGTLKSGTVALSLDKGPLVVVAVLAVLKAGLAWVPLPTDAPRLRIQKILEISQAGLVLTSQDTLHLTDGLTTNLVLDDLETDRKIQQQASTNLPATVSPDDLCHVIFTSGSTGIPKGVMIEHRAVFHNARVLAELFALHEHTRTLQFAAYTFDVFGLDLFMTFFAGGCLVMGNVSDMMSDLTGFVNHTHVNYAQLTPTVISLLDPTSVPSLEVLASSGEPLTAEIVQQWRHRVRLINAYGPTETIVCTVQDMTAGDLAEPQIIGTAIKGSEVLVMLEGCAEEAPLGTVGEICVGGIQLFRSYLGVDHSHSGFFFHRGSQKFYRTGDFGVVTQLSGAHNVIRCLGRQDSQVKVHGVRVDLGDVESAIGSHTVTRHCISLAPKSGPLQGRLAAVLTVDHVGGNWEQITTGVPEMNVLQPTESVQRERLRGLVACVQEMVPPQAVPSIWWVVDKFPLTVSGKLDRISVQRWLEGMTKQDYTQLMQAWHTEQEDSATSSGSVAIQRRLVGLCSRVLGVDVIAVNPHAPMLHIGFDSLTIIQLVSLARREGIDLNVQQALRESSISQLSASLSRERPTTARTGQSIDEEPFSLAPEGADLQELKASVAEQCHVAPDDVLDVYPCTQLQSGMMALAARRSDAYICVMSFLLSPKVDKTRFEVAWEQLQSGVPLLQNRIVHGLGAGGLLQATIRHRITPISDDVFNSTMSFGDSLCRGRVVWDDTAHAWKFIMKIHHSLFDGWTKGLMLLELKKIYESRDLPAPTVTPFKRVVAYLVEDINSNGKKHSLFWRHYLDGCDVTDFPRMTLKWTGELTSHRTLIHDINVDTSTTTKTFQVTATSVIQAAWALVLGKHTGTDDVAFGSTLSGRNLPVEDVDRIIGPTMTTVPCRVRWDRSTTLRSFLEQLHRHSVELISHQHYGLQDIASLGQDAKNACSFRSILVVQPDDTSADNLSDFIREEEHLGSDVLRTYPLAIEYIPLDSKSARIKAHYDENVVQKEMLLWVIRHFESALRKFGFADPEVAVADIEVMDRAEVEQVLALSRSHSPKIDRCLHELVQEAVDNFPDYVAIRQFSPPKTVSYRELDRLSNSLSRRLIHLYNVGVGGIVPLAFEKSALAIIAMMAVLKAGAAYVLLDASQPVQRLQQMTRLLKSRLTLCSSRCFPAMQNVGGQALEINDECLSETGLDLDPTDIHHMPASPCDLAVVFFTSGSTGQPKGVASSHSAVSTAMSHFARMLRIVPGLRVFQFTTFTFDMGLKDIYCTLLSGGCICLPDEQDRLNPEAMREMDVNVAFLTPSIAETIEVEDVPNLQILNLGGERATASVIRKWADRVRLINSYGPTETVACLTAADWLTHDANPDHIGQAVTGQMWIVQRNSTGCIVPSPIGCVGEIAIAGFTVARGYLNDPVKSGEAFVEPPEWMWPAVAGSRLYLTGDLGIREPSGDVRYVGRNDRQVKIHGIRIEPTEAEHHLRRLGGIFTSAIVDSARLTEAESSLSLVAFVLVHGGRDEQETSSVIVDPEFVPVDFYTACQDAQVRLAERIPRHLVPKYFIPVHHFPLSSSSKTDRRRLRDALENDAHGDHHVAMNSTRGASERLPPQTKLERCVCEAWKTVLSAETPFGLNDDFFRVGGDSFAVIKLVLVCRKKGLQLSAADVYDRPTLARMAAAAVELPVAEKTKTGEAETPDPFSLLPGSVESLLVEAAQVCDVDVEEIEDMYPASPFQEGLAAVNLHTKSAYMARWVYHLPGSADLDRLRTAMEFVIARNPILRTTLAHLSCGTTQVVLKYGSWTTKGHEEDAGIEGNRLFAYSLSRTDRGDTCLQIDMHHVLYDEWTVGFFLDDLVHNYSTPGSERQGRPGYAKFIRHLANTDYEASAAFWRGNLEHTSPSNFPRAPQSGCLPQTRAAVQSADQICLEESNRSAITPAVVSAAALAVLLSSYAQTEDVVFGVTLSGRHVPGLEEVAGPTISTVPLRLKKTGGGEQSTTTAADFLALVQSKMRALQDHHHFGLRRIRQLGGEGCRSACAFRTLLVVQQDARRLARAAGVLLDLRPVDEETSMSLNYGLVVLLCTDHATGSARFRIEYDPDSIAEQQARRVLRQLTEIARRLSSMQGTLGAIKADCGEGFEQPMQTEPQNGDVGSHGGKTALQTASQSRLRHIWANAMNLPPESIGASDTIYGLGGDSMTLIKLLYGARKKGFRLVVGGEVNQFTTLADMSRSLEEASRRLEPEGPARFSLVKGMSEQECIEDAAAKCNVDAARVEDVYPCTSLQEGLMALSSREAGSYVAQNCFKILGTDVDMNRLQSAILRVWHAEPILRTRIFVGAKLTTFQAVIRGDVGICQHGHALHEFLARDREIPFEYGQPLSRFALVDDGRGQAHLVLSQHHAVSDGWATNLLVNAIKREYGGAGQLNRVNRMPSFVKFVGSTQHSSEAALFWKTVLDGASATEFPHSRKNDGFRAAAWASTACSIARARGTALPTVLEAAWGLVLGRHAASDDVCFGTVRSGRTAAVAEIDSLMGPAIVTVPRRLKPQAALSVAQYLEQVYYQAAQALPFEQLGLQRIRELGEDTRNACSFRTLLIIQPEQPALQDEPGGLALEQVDVESMVGTYALSMYCLLGEDGELTMRINYDDGVVCESEVRWIAYHFCQAATQLAERAGGLVGDVDLCGDEDRKQIACWNASKVDATEQRIEEAFRQRLGQWTGLSAVDGHDRRLTYAELDGAARGIAQLLRDRGVRCGDLVLVCMEKSALMVAALLGVFMAGAGYIPLAIDNPVDRLKSIVGQAPAQMLLCSRQQEPLCRVLAPAAAAVLDWELLDGRPAAADGSTQKAQPTDLAYIMYTSGSTGVPKGVMLSHTALSTRMLAQGSRLGYRPGTRALQFCSYAFDCSLTEMFMTLLHGGCVCVPTEEQRLTSLADVINAERIDMAVLTATVVGGMLQHPDRVPGLSTLMLVGEPVTQHIVDAWSGRVRVINDYGPTEACVDAVINVGVGRDTDPANIGHPVAAYAWVVDAADRAKLAPVGCPGELLLAGPTLAVGYAGDTARTDAVFLPAARFPWARRDVARLYATGDVVRQQPDGSLVFVARNDTQAKLRGLRIELREIEFLLEKADHIAAAVADVVAGQALVAFVAVKSGARVRPAVRAALDGLRAALPRYMVPQAVLPLASIPMTVSGKTDRSALRRLYDKAARSDLVSSSLSSECRAPETAAQATLRRLWADVLAVDADMIGINADFVVLGGNSVAAIQLSAHARAEGISLPARCIFQHPVLEQMALHMTQLQPQAAEPMPSMHRRQIGETYRIANIEDVYPCTPLQAGLIALTLRQPRAYVATEQFLLAPSTDVARFKAAWDAVYRRHEMLRTRLCQVDDNMVQVVCSGDAVPWSSPDEEEDVVVMGLGSPLVRFSLQGRCFRLTRHHSIYDGWSSRLLWDDVQRAYTTGRDPPPRPPFRAYVQHLLGLDRDAATSFWAKELAGADADHYPRLPPGRPWAETSQSVELVTTFADDFKPTLTFSNVARAAWALVLAARGRRPAPTHDVCFGAVASGRMEPVLAVEDIAGPTLATVPVRVRIDMAEPVRAYLSRIGQNALETAPCEHVGLRAIAGASRDAEAACRFANLLVVQPPDSPSAAAATPLCRPVEAAGGTGMMLQPYGIVLECCELADGRGLRAEASFDDGLISRQEMRGLLDHFSRAVGLLVDPAHGASSVAALVRNLTTAGDYSQMLSFNGPPLPRLPICLHELVEESARLHPQRVAVLARDQTLSYAELDRAASRLAAHLQRRFGVGPRKLVPLCFEKSSYMVIAMLAVLKAGGGYVPLDPSHPGARLRQVHEQTGADLVLVSAAQQRRVVDEVVGASVFVVDAAACREPASGGGTPEPCTGPHDVAYVIFTSGSTGRPKGVVMEHGSVSRSMTQYGRVFGYRREKPFRTLQFSSYAFDVSVAEVFATLAFGGAVCVPADDERLSNLPGVVASMQVGVAFLTPTMAGAMRPEEAPSLELLCLTGEARTPSAVRAWTSWASSAAQRRLFDAYGPTEAAVHCCAARVERDTPPNNIGSPFGGQLWIVDAEDHTRLLPVGCAGELVISGATLARGYLNNAEETAKAFIDHVSWLEDGEARRIYKTGDVGRFACDGTIEFLGRKDGRQVKLHGVRVELSDVEAALQSCEAAVSNVMAARVSIAGNESLVAFVQTPEIMAMAQHADDERPELIAPSLPPSLKSWIRATLGSLRRLLPAYMIPSLLLPVPVWPRTTSGKTDRRMLCNAASSLAAGVPSLYQAAGSAEPERGATLNRAERAKSKQKMLGSNRTSVAETHDQVADSWRRALRRDSEIRIMAEDDFFAAGGDSVSAIFLVAELRRKNMHITVSDVYRCRSLGDMVDLVLSAHEDDDCVGATTKPFSLLQQPAGSQLQHLLDDAASQLGIDSNSIEDMYPCTPLQNGIMFLSERVTGSYHGHFRLLMPRKLDVNRLYHAFEKLVEMHDILRTRIIFDRSFGGLQVVLNSAAHLKTLRKFTEREKTTAFRYGSPLYRYTLTAGGDGIYLELVCHHSMYDGWSLPLLVEDLRCLYHDIDFSPDPTTPFKDMVAYACNPSIIRAAEEFWDVYLDGAAVSDFPEVADRVHHSIRATAYHERAVTAIEKKASQRITMATILAAAWSIVVSRHAGSSDVCFGVLLSGRNAPVAEIEGIRGPTINTVPFRVVLDPASTTTSAVLEQVQSHMVAMIPHQFIDLAKLRKAFAGARQDFGSLLAIQSAGSSSTDGGGRDFSLSSAPSEKAQVGAMFGEPYPLFLEATTVAGPGNDVLLAAQFDPEILSIGHVERILGQYETAIRLLAGVELGSTLVSEAALLSASDEQCLRDWAGEPIQPEADCVHQMIERFAAAHPEKQAIDGCGEHVTYAQLEQRANSLADHLLRLGKNVGPGMIVPVWMETSPTAVVALLSILKLGASYVPLDHRLPVARAQSIANDVAADVMLVSKEMSDAASQVVRQISDRGVTVVQVDMEMLETRTTPSFPRAQPSDLAYVIYTSGSTGEPKGVMMEHWALTATVKAQAATYGFDCTTRMFGLASLSWDPSILEIFATLSHGGCLCIPTERERSQDLVGAINRLRADQISTSPAVASLIDLCATPTVKVIALGGEVVREENIRNAHEAGVRLFNIYGPSEACIDAIVHRNVVPGVDTRNIGRPMSSQVWIVDPGNPRRLAPPGCVGEIALSGTLARGYLNDAVKTASRFVTDCPYASPVYLTGDLGRHHVDGSVYFLGRKDRQVKLNGQRVELGEIDDAIRTLCPGTQVAVDYFSTTGDAKKRLVVFSSSSPSSPPPERGDRGRALVQVESRLRPESGEFQLLQARLKNKLPRYMVPRIFITVSYLPLSNADKVDFHALRAAYTRWEEKSAASVDQDAEFPPPSPPSTPSLTTAATMLRSMWASVIGCPEQSIRAHDDIFDLGADSLTVLKLATLARTKGISMSVADVYASPTLLHMARLVPSSVADESSPVGDNLECPPKFSLLPDFIRKRLLEKGTESDNEVIDAYPCTTIQTTSLIQGQKRHKAHYAWFLLQIKGSADELHLRKACGLLSERHSALRTTFRIIDGQFIQQLHKRPRIDFQKLEPCDSVEAFCSLLDQNVPNPVNFDQVLTRYRIAEYADGRGYLLAIGMSHAQYDGFCWSTILNDLQQASMSNGGGKPSPPFSRFIGHMLQTSRDVRTQSFWRDLLRGCTMTTFTGPAEQTHLRRVLDRKHVGILPRYDTRPGNATFAMIVKSAWAIVLSCLSGSADVTFGSLVFGRDPEVAGVGEMVGACINVVPNRVSLADSRENWTASDLLEHVRRQQVEMGPFETTPLPTICRSADWPSTTRFGSIVQHQNIDESVFASTGTMDPASSSSDKWNYLGNASYPGVCDDVIDCWITTVPLPDETRLEFAYNRSSISDDVAASITSHLCDTVRAIYEDPRRRLSSLRPPRELNSLVRIRLNGNETPQAVAEAERDDHGSVPEGERQNHLMNRLRELWSKVLPLPESSASSSRCIIDDNDISFFAIGGDSGSAMQLAAICESEGLELGVQGVFDCPTRRLQAARLLACGHQTKAKEKIELIFEPKLG